MHIYCNSSAAMHSEKMFKTEAETFLVSVKMDVAIFQLLEVGTYHVVYCGWCNFVMKSSCLHMFSLFYVK